MQPEGRPFIRFHRLPTVGLAHTVYSLFGNLLSRLGLAVSGLVLSHSSTVLASCLFIFYV